MDDCESAAGPGMNCAIRGLLSSRSLRCQVAQAWNTLTLQSAQSDSIIKGCQSLYSALLESEASATSQIEIVYMADTMSTVQHSLAPCQ